MGESTEEPDVEKKVTEEANVEAEELIPIIDLSSHYIKPDQFEGIDVLAEELGKLEGAPNFRQLTGFPIFGTGQPTEEGMVKILNQIKKEKEIEKIIWFSMRQEPIVYVNGSPYAPRAPNNPHANIITDLNDEQAKSVCIHLSDVLSKRVNIEENEVKIHIDRDFAENPLDRVDLEKSIVVESIKDLDSVYDFCRAKCNVKLEVFRIPVVEDQMPDESCFDRIISALKDEPASTPCVFSCQMGKGRTTVGMVVASLLKEIQISTQLRNMEADSLIKAGTLRDLLYEKFEKTIAQSEEEDDPLTKGDFSVIKELCASLPGAREAKKKLDIIIDKCGPPPRGVGIQNLRECIMETKWKYDVAREDRQYCFKVLIINFIERYFHLICFTTYALQWGPTGYTKSFQDWMEENKDLKIMASEGKDKLEWCRTVDAEKLEQLKELLNNPNYKDNLAQLIRTVFEFAYITYSDLPRGEIKNNSMKKLAATTLMEILPTEVAAKVAKKLDDDPHITHDFLTIIGLVSYL